MHYGISESHTTNHTIRYLSDDYIDIKCDALRDLVAFVQLKKRDRHPWRSVDFNKVAG